MSAQKDLRKVQLKRTPVTQLILAIVKYLLRKKTNFITNILVSMERPTINESRLLGQLANILAEA